MAKNVAQDGRHAIGRNLNADAGQNERGQSHEDVRSGRSERAQNPVGVPVAEKDAGGDDNDADRMRECSQQEWPQAAGGFAPSVSATDIEPGPTVSGIVMG